MVGAWFTGLAIVSNTSSSTKRQSNLTITSLTHFNKYEGRFRNRRQKEKLKKWMYKNTRVIELQNFNKAGNNLDFTILCYYFVLKGDYFIQKVYVYFFMSTVSTISKLLVVSNYIYIP